MRKLALITTLLCAIAIATAAVSHGDSSSQPTLPSSAPTEPITGSPIVNAPGDETPRHDPFTPYDVGPSPWAYDHLEAADKPVADRGRDVTGWDSIHADYAVAVKVLAQQAAANSAAIQLGTDGVANAGVVP